MLSGMASDARRKQYTQGVLPHSLACIPTGSYPLVQQHSSQEIVHGKHELGTVHQLRITAAYLPT